MEHTIHPTARYFPEAGKDNEANSRCRNVNPAKSDVETSSVCSEQERKKRHNNSERKGRNMDDIRFHEAELVLAKLGWTGISSNAQNARGQRKHTKASVLHGLMRMTHLASNLLQWLDERDSAEHAVRDVVADRRRWAYPNRQELNPGIELLQLYIWPVKDESLERHDKVDS